MTSISCACKELLEREFKSKLDLNCQIELAHGMLDILSANEPAILVGVIEMDIDMARDMFRFREAGINLLKWKESVDRGVSPAKAQSRSDQALRVETCVVSPLPFHQLSKSVIALLRTLGVHVVSTAGEATLATANR